MNAATITSLFWCVFIGYWIISAVSAKKNVQNKWNLWGVGIRVITLVVVIVILRTVGVKNFFGGSSPLSSGPSNMAVAILGVVLCGLGIGLAIWARVHLGRNWGMPMSHKKDPELVTSGPYSLIRHPIYTGVFLAAVGSILTTGLLWLLLLIVMGIYFIYSAGEEEKIMTAAFPDQYPAYKARTKMLIPYIF
jgi:protein-S-isoprenylcysteine O-methyltransferase Ste14